MKEKLLDMVAPCSLMCFTCTGYEKGIVCKLANQMVKYTEGLEEFYEMHVPQDVPQFKSFTNELQKYADGKCGGCRNGKENMCRIGGCFILECTKEHQVDYCGECSNFPCSKVKDLFEEIVYKQWLTNNQEIKEKGIEKYFTDNCQKPHCSPYKK